MPDTNAVTIAYVDESTFGVTPSGPPTLQEVRLRNFSSSARPTNGQANERDTNYDLTDVTRLAEEYEASGQGVLSYGQYDGWFKNLLRSTGWSTAVKETNTTYAMVASGNKITDSGSAFVSDGFVANQWVYISGFTDPANNGYFFLSSVAAGEMVLVGGTVVDEAAGDSVTVNMGAQLVNATTTTSMSIEEALDSSNFKIGTGVVPSGFGLTLDAQEFALVDWSFIGKELDFAGATAGDGSNTAAPNYTRMNATSHVARFLENNAAATWTSFGLQVETNNRTRPQGGSLTPIGVGLGQFNVTGTFEQYFEDITLANKFKDQTETSFAAGFHDGSRGIMFHLPAVELTNIEVGDGEINQDVFSRCEWTAKRHDTQGVTLRIARFE